MQLLTRTETPTVLNLFDYRSKKWDDISTKQKDSIWISLTRMQGKRCAYCQQKIAKGSRHIEHFKQRRDYPNLTFSWDNLFGSCTRQDGCGFYKDTLKYDENNLIKTDVDNPALFFEFLTSGRVKVRPELSQRDRERAEETLRIFNLNPDTGPLKHNREQAIKAQKRLSDEMFLMMTLFMNDPDIDEKKEMLKDILDEHLSKFDNFPFEAAIRDHFTSIYENFFR
jgi:uncharacterized protein (TIGR02646 family)